MANFGYGSIDDLLPKQPLVSLPTNSVGAASVAPIMTPGSQVTPQLQSIDSSENETSAEAKLATKMADLQLEAREEEARALADRKNLGYINLIEFPVGPDSVGILPEAQARGHQIIPFFRDTDRGEVRLGAVNPDDPALPALIEDLKRQEDIATVVMYVISQHSFETALRAYQGVVKIKPVVSQVTVTATDIQRYVQEFTDRTVFQHALNQANMTQAFAMVLAMALQYDSSDIHIEAADGAATIRYRIDGLLTDIATLPADQLPRFVSRVKTIAQLKLNVTTIPQDGRISIQYGDEPLDIRVSVLPSAFGESIVMRLLKSSSMTLTLTDLGLRPSQLTILQHEIDKPNGMIITTGPTGSGKTTTLYAILNTLNTPQTKIITLENPVEYKLSGIVQSQVDTSKRYTFAEGLKAILRQDPDIIMVGEIRDQDTAKTAVDASLTGHLMLSTIHTNDAAGAVPRFLGMGVEGMFLAPALNAVIGQRLVRRLCQQCRTTATLSAETMQRAQSWAAAISPASGETVPDLDTITWYAPVGCQACHQTGYKGRVGIYEIFTMSKAIEQEIIASQVSEYRMKELLHEAGMLTMGQDGLLKAVEGLTTMDEVLRVAKE